LNGFLKNRTALPGDVFACILRGRHSATSRLVFLPSTGLCRDSKSLNPPPFVPSEICRSANDQIEILFFNQRADFMDAPGGLHAMATSAENRTNCFQYGLIVIPPAGFVHPLQGLSFDLA